MSKGNEEGRAIPPEGQDGEPAEENRLSRGKFIAAAGAAGAGFMAAGAPAAMARGWSRSSRNKALTAGQHAPGMIGGPTGFPGAARYQYPANSEEGRAVLAARALRKAGKAPDTLVVQALNFARPQFENKFPKGATRRSPSIWEQETGIKLKFVETNPASEYATNIRNASTKNGSFDLVTGAIEDTGDYAEAGLLRPLDDYVRKYRPSWNDPKYGYAGGRPTVQLFTQYNGRTYWVAFDNDTQPYVYRWDLFNNPREKTAFEDKYGQPLTVPKTWDDQAKIAEFFNRPKASTPLYGSVERKCPFWGIVNWEHRFLCSARPEHVLLQARRVGERQQHGRDPRGNRASALARLVGAGRALEGLARAVPALRGGQRRPGRHVPERDQADPAGEQDVGQGLRQVPADGRAAGPDGERKARPPDGDLLQHLVRCERVRAEVAPRGRLPVPAVGGRRADVHLPDGEPRRVSGSAPHDLAATIRS